MGNSKSFIIIIFTFSIFSAFPINADEPTFLDTISSKTSIDDIESLTFYKKSALIFIWKKQYDKLRKLNHNFPLESYIFTEKCIEEINDKNPKKNLLYLTANKLIESDKSLHILKQKLAEKTTFITNFPLSEVILEPYVDERHSGDELFLSEFHELLFEITQFYGYNRMDYGLSELIKKNPKSAVNFIDSVLEQHSQLDHNSSLFQIICNVALLYRNHHHANDLLTKINVKYNGVAFFFEDENKHHTDSLSIFEGRKDPFTYIENKTHIIKKLLNELKFEEAKNLLDKYTKHAEIMFSSIERSRPYKYMEPLGVDIFLFQALVEIRLGNKSRSKTLLDDLSSFRRLGYDKKLFAYPAIMSDHITEISKKIDIIDTTFIYFQNKNNYSYSFDDFMVILTGNSYLKLAYDYEVFNTGIGNANSEDLFQLYDLLLNIQNQISSIGNEVINFSTMKNRLSLLRLDIKKYIEQEFGEELKSMSQTDIAKFYAEMGFIYLLTEFYNETKKNGQISSNEIAAMQNQTGAIFLQKHEPNIALKYLNLAYDYFSLNEKQEENIKQLSYISSNIGFAFYQKKKLEKSLLWLQKSLTYSNHVQNKETFDMSEDIEKNISKHIFKIQNGIGVKYLLENEADTAITYFDNALQFTKKNKYKLEGENLANLYNNIGSAYRIKKDWVSSKKWLEKCLLHSRHIKYEKVLCYTYCHLCEVNIGLKNEDEALKCCLESLKICEKENLAHCVRTFSFQHIPSFRGYNWDSQVQA